jgi:hypothetical protein
MIRFLIVSIALFATSAAAQTVHTVTGANPPAQYRVCADDTLVLKKHHALRSRGTILELNPSSPSSRTFLTSR